MIFNFCDLDSSDNELMQLLEHCVFDDKSFHKTDEFTLYQAIQNGNIKFVKLFIEHAREDLYVAEQLLIDYDDALQYAIQCRRPAILSLLLKSGAINRLNKINTRTALHLAVECDSLCIVEILIDYGIDVNAVDHEWNQTALHYACKSGNVDIVQILLRNHSNIDAKDYYNNTPIGIACKYSQYDVVYELIKSGANLCELNSFTNISHVLRIAIERDDKHIVRILLEHNMYIDFTELYVKKFYQRHTMDEDFSNILALHLLRHNDGHHHMVDEIIRMPEYRHYQEHANEIKQMQLHLIGTSKISYYQFCITSVNELDTTLLNDKIFNFDTLTFALKNYHKYFHFILNKFNLVMETHNIIHP